MKFWMMIQRAFEKYGPLKFVVTHDRNAPPGKSWPEEIDNETPEEKRARFEAWVDGKAAAARATLKQKEPGE